MERFGFIHDELDIKILILYVLNRLPSPTSFQTLSDLVLIDDGFDYFQYSKCLADLVDSAHVEKNEYEDYAITQKGIEHCEASSSRVPYSVRAKADKTLKPVADKMRRDAMIVTSHKALDSGGCMVKLKVSDDMGTMLDMSVLASDEESAQGMEKYFRRNAERVYQKLTDILTADSGDRKEK